VNQIVKLTLIGTGSNYKAGPLRGQVILGPAVAVFLNSFSTARTLLVPIVKKAASEDAAFIVACK
jgi:hypothetical protein